MDMKKHRAVVDTNVLYAGLYSQTGASFQLLRLIDRGRLVPLLSTTLLFEYEDVLKRNQEVLKLSNRAVNDVLDGFCLRGECRRSLNWRRLHVIWRHIGATPRSC